MTLLSRRPRPTLPEHISPAQRDAEPQLEVGIAPPVEPNPPVVDQPLAPPEPPPEPEPQVADVVVGEPAADVVVETPALAPSLATILAEST